MLPLIQGDLSFNRVGLGKAPGAFALDVSGTIQASNVSLGRLNGVTWTSSSPANGTVPTYTGSAVEWQAPGAGAAAAWSSYPATQFVNVSGYDLSGIVSFNSVSAVFVSVSRQVGFGSGVLDGNTGSNVVAFGTGAGSGGTTNNMIFLGSNPGYTPAASNSFIVYSTSATVPFLQGDVSGRLLGIGMVPRSSNALDVCGTIAADSFFTSPTSASTIGPVYISNSTVGIGAPATPPYKFDVQGPVRVSNIIANDLTVNNTIGGITLSNNTLTVGTIAGVTNLGGLSTKFDSANQVIFIGQQYSTTPLPAGSANVFLGQFAGAAYLSTGTVGIGPGAGAFLSGSNNTCIGRNAGNSATGSNNNFIGNLAGQTNYASFVNAIGASAGYGNLASFVDAIGYQAAVGNANTGTNLVAIGSNAGFRNQGASNIFIGSGAGAADSTTNVSCAIVIGAGAGIQGSSYRVGTRSVIIGTSTFASGTDSIAIGTNVSASSSNSIVIGSNASTSGSNSIALGIFSGGGGTGSCNVIAIGNAAGMSSANVSNSIYLGNNPGYNPTSNNTFVLYSTNATTPALQVDLSQRWLGVGKVPTTALDVSGQIRTTSNIINTINVSLVTTDALAVSTTNYSTYFNLLGTSTVVTITLPGTDPIQGSYWVVKNNSTVNYTLSCAGGFLNVSPITSMYLQAGNGVTLIYSGANSVYYTF